MTDDDAPAPDALLAAGKHAEAAAAFLLAGHATRAADIYEQIWDFRAAADAARAAGDLPRALRCALEARDDGLAREVTARLATTVDGQRTAMDALARARRHSDAADLAIALGDRERAIDLLQRAHRDLDAAQLLEQAGRDRDAGRLLERVLEVATGDDAAIAHLGLGRILARRGALPDAARHLQDATRSDTHRGQARRQLIVVLASMDLRDAARDVLVAARADEPTLAPELDAYLRAWRDAAPPPPAREAQLIAGRYRVERALGAGAAGRVVLAHDEVGDRLVAIKIIHGAGQRGGAGFERFRREAQIASTLRHPSLVETYDVALEQGLLVMEYLPGGSLAQRLGAGDDLGDAGVRRMALELLGALEVAHQRGVVHRDLKPANILFDARGTAKLGDFGVAHVVDLGQTQTGGLIGTLAYMSPEQITGAPISVAADVYGLGVTLFEALTQRQLFLGPDYVAQHLGDTPPRAASVRPSVNAGWDDLLAVMLRKAPTERPSVAAVRSAIEAMTGGGRALQLPRARPTTAPPPDAARPMMPRDPDNSAPRYQHETALGRTPTSRLTRAVDHVLDRSVVLERFDDSPEAHACMAHARAMAAASSPFVQRALSMDVAERLVVFEAPAGAPWPEAAIDTSPRELLRLLKRMARALIALHEIDVAHGAVAATTVVVDDGLVPTLLAASLPATASDAATADDVHAVIALCATRLGLAPTWQALAAVLAPNITTPPEPGTTGGELYGALDQLEIALLRS